MSDAATAVETMVKQLRNRSHGKSIGTTCEARQTIEGDADRIMIGLLRGLYQKKSAPIGSAFRATSICSKVTDP